MSIWLIVSLEGGYFVELCQLEYFIQICKSGSFTKAKEELGVTQPTT
ncbi:LysR family transcriptional regulator [Paenibacillus provencensis]|uniref:LysR family transcriptional regulator n=1 Tax=Paenibacillus provencensis TaxID=441151 RepID=A0ABW3Q2L7_9BACL